MVKKSPIDTIKYNISIPRFLRDTGLWDGQEERIACPIHNGKDKNFAFDNNQYKCYSCGAYGGDVINLVMDLYQVDLKEALRMIDDSYHLGIYNEITEAQHIINNKKKNDFEITYKDKIVSIDEIEERDFTEKHKKRLITDYQYDEKNYGKGFMENLYLINRGISLKIQNLFEIYFTYEQDYIVNFPLKKADGKVVGVAKRNISTKRYRYQKGCRKPLYGEYELRKILKKLNKEKVGYVFVVEGMIDCLTLWTWGYPSIALHGLGSVKQIQELLQLPTEMIILALDNDEAGQNAAEKLLDQLRGNGKIIGKLDWGNSESKDINDLSEEEFRKLKFI